MSAKQTNSHSKNHKKKNSSTKNRPDIEIIVPRSSQDVLESMINACCFRETENACTICQALKAKLAILQEGNHRTPVEHNAFLIEQHQSRIITSQFLSSTGIAKPSASKSESLFGSSKEHSGDTKTGSSGKIFTDSSGSPEDPLAFQRNSQKIDDSVVSDDKNISLSYGLHDLICDIEQSPNHHVVLEGLSQTQLRSLFAQITSKQTLIKEDKGAENALAAMRLVRIEQELNDLMVKEEAVREMAVISSGAAHGSTVPKRSNHEPG